MSTKLLAVAITLAFSTAVCAQEAPPKRSLPTCEAPMANVLVSKVSCKSANCNGGTAGANSPLMALLSAAGQPSVSAIGDGIKDMFVTALRETNCVDIVDQEALKELAEQMGRPYQMPPVDFVVSGALTSVELQTDNTNIGAGFIPIIGSVGFKTQKASVSLDMKLVDANTLKVLSSRRVDANSESTSFGVGGLGAGTMNGNAVGFGGGFSSLKGTSLEAVSRDAVFGAAAFVVDALRTRAAAAAKPGRTLAAAPTLVEASAQASVVAPVEARVQPSSAQ